MNPRDLAQANDASPLGALPLDEPMPEHFRPLGHDYALIERIGEGGMGEVWRARQLSTGREVAVKLLRHSRPDDRFAQEVSALAKVQHPGIVRLFQAGQHEGRPFLVMELITGPTLADRLKQERLNPRVAAQFLREAAEAISAAHAQGIVHRDLKPSNLLLDGSGKVRVTDFGLAKDLNSDRQLTVTGEQLGTPAYMAPEQIDPRCGEIGPVTDVYELGATLYHAVTGAQPFAGNSTAETLHRVSTGEPDWKTPWKGIHRDLLIICQNAMRREPGRRYASARDFAADLENFLGGKPIKARPATLGERAWRLARQPGSVAVVVCVALAVFLFPVWRSLSARSQISELLPDWPTTPPQVYNKLVMQVPQKPGRLAAFSDVRGLFVTGVGNGAVRQVELDPWKIVANSLSRSAGDAEFMQFLPGTDHLLVVERPGSWKLWTVGHERKVIVAGDSHERNHLVALSPDGRRWAFGTVSGKVISCYYKDTPTLPRVISADTNLTDLVFTHASDQLLTSHHYGRVCVWQLSTSKMVAEANLGGLFDTQLALSPDDRMIAVAGLQILSPNGPSTLRVARFDGLQVVATNSFRSHIKDLIYSPDGGRLAALSNLPFVQLWNSQVRELCRTGDSSSVPVAIQFSRDGLRLLTLDQNGDARLWDAHTGQPLTDTWRGEKGFMHVEFSPDGLRVGTGDVDNSGTVWEARCPMPQGWDRPALVKALLRDGRIEALRRAAWLSADDPEVLRRLATVTAIQGPEEMWQKEAAFLRRLADSRSR